MTGTTKTLKQEPQVNNTTTVFKQSGQLIKRAIYELVRGTLEPGRQRCLDALRAMLSLDNETDPIGKAVGLMVTLEEGIHLSASALAAQAQIQRAATLTREIRELKCIAANLHDSEVYKITLEEAQRYGLL